MPSVYRAAVESTEEACEEGEIVPNNSIRRKLRNGNIVRSIIQSGREIEIVGFKYFIAVEGMNSLNSISTPSNDDSETPTLAS
jgi:FAD synthase